MDPIQSNRCIHGTAFNSRFSYRLRLQQPVVRKHCGAYFSLIHLWSTTRNYYHWMHDSLKRLYGILEYLPDDTEVHDPVQTSVRSNEKPSFFSG